MAKVAGLLGAVLLVVRRFGVAGLGIISELRLGLVFPHCEIASETVDHFPRIGELVLRA